MRINEYGLTFQEWLEAANMNHETYTDCKETRQAWIEGEDPTDWCYAFEILEQEK